MSKINGFTFYYDYYYLIDTMPIEDKKELAVAILDYVFLDKKPNLNGHNQAIFNTLSHQLDKSKNKSNKNQNETKTKPNQNQNETKLISNENQMKIKSKSNQNQNDIQNSILNFKFYISNLDIDIKLKDKILQWLKYKAERKEYYKETGFKTLVKKIIDKSKEFGIQETIDVIDDCMASNYKGIVFDKFKDIKKSNKVSASKWLDKNFEKEENSPEEIAELNELLKEFK